MYISILSFISFFCLIFLISSFKIDVFSVFEQRLMNFLLIVSFFAVIITKGYTLQIIPLLVILGIFAIYRKNFHFNSLTRIELFSGFGIFILFYIYFFVASGFVMSFPHEDYLIYERIGHYNVKYGVENTRTFYNAISDDQPKIEIYHYFEMWATSFLMKINNLKFLENYILIICPAMIWITLSGFKELISDKKSIISMILLVSIILFINPYDVILRIFDIKLPISGLGGIIIALKNIFILPIVVYLLIQISKNKLNYILLCTFSFYYIITFPIMIVSTSIFNIINSKMDWRSFKYIVISGLLFIALTYLLNQSAITSRISFDSFLNISFSAKVFIMGFILPTSLLIVLYYFRQSKEFNFDWLMMFISVSFTGSFFWILFSENIDSNQLHRNFGGTFFSLILIIFIFNLSINTYLKFSFLIFNFVFSFWYIKAFNNNVRLSFEESHFLDSINNYNSLIFYPNMNYVNSVYKYNERLNFKYLKIFYYRPELDVFNFASFYPLSDGIDTESEKFMIEIYRSISPFIKISDNEISDKYIFEVSSTFGADTVIVE